MKKSFEHIDKLRSYANILSNSNFERIVREDDFSLVHSKFRKYDKGITAYANLTYGEYFKSIYKTLLENYRNEYVYKTFIINAILLEKYNLNSTTAINEFKVNTSIADLVLFNGTSKVFEIKTELDNPDRLLNQISDYKKVFKEIYLVTHHSLLQKYLKIITDDIGIIILTQSFTLQTIREPITNLNLDNVSIMKCLRKIEYTNIIKDYFGKLPEVSAFVFYSSCKDLICKIPSLDLHDRMVSEIKKRQIREKQTLSSNFIPKELKNICLCLNFNAKEYNRLGEVLSAKMDLK